MANVAENMVETLAKSGVKRVYGVVGDSLNGFTEAIRQQDGIDWFAVRHEEAAAFAAGAEAALTDHIAVCAGSCGPGNLHLINGLYDANRSGVPVLAIAAHIPHAEIGGGYFQETHPENLFQECSVYCEMVSTPEQMPRLMRLAMRAAIERHGVAVLVVPGELFLDDVHGDSEAIRPAGYHVIPDDADLERAARALSGAKNITMLVGAGAQGAHDEVVAMARHLQAPIVHTMRGKQWIAYDNPFDVGMTGLLGFTSGYTALVNAQTLLIVGADLPYRQFYPKNATVIQIDVNGDHFGRRTHVDVALRGTVKDTLPLLQAKTVANSSDRFLKRMLNEYSAATKDLDDLAKPSRSVIHPQYISRLLDTYADDDAVLIPDVGTPVIWAARYMNANGKRSIIGSFVHGSMANALPQAIGAAASQPGRQVIAMCGDGGLSMLMGELVTVNQHQLPIKVVVYDNASLNFVALEMKQGGYVDYGTQLNNPNFAAVANAVGIKGFRVEKSSELEQTMKEFLAWDGPAVLDVRTATQELTIPPTINVQQMKGFTLYALRTVLSGRGSDLIDMARVNMRQAGKVFKSL
ncbi:ubiquinone-dependent pyruvate dehydrogenase [Neoactinobaculum massilliense]|uniref:ubiquinone-dependent pyruvate dehydrogenase n=1 Tax=Neoactinobaculum massilliense TaxID=2364794 RepID=UPI000F53F315|nr:ubiquinone-dependent pyruvate dehydrogenase [Neoactinobaculum massilliense]